MPENELLTLEKLTKEQLEQFVRQLIDRDFSRLVQILYRLDVSEQKLKAVLAENPAADTGAMIAQLIMERMEQSRKTRENFRTEGNIPENEKW